jgi:hypothetical protein
MLKSTRKRTQLYIGPPAAAAVAIQSQASLSGPRCGPGRTGTVTSQTGMHGGDSDDEVILDEGERRLTVGPGHGAQAASHWVCRRQCAAACQWKVELGSHYHHYHHDPSHDILEWQTYRRHSLTVGSGGHEKIRVQVTVASRRQLKTRLGLGLTVSQTNYRLYCIYFFKIYCFRSNISKCLVATNSKRRSGKDRMDLHTLRIVERILWFR